MAPIEYTYFSSFYTGKWINLNFMGVLPLIIIRNFPQKVIYIQVKLNWSSCWKMVDPTSNEIYFCALECKQAHRGDPVPA